MMTAGVRSGAARRPSPLCANSGFPGNDVRVERGTRRQEAWRQEAPGIREHWVGVGEGESSSQGHSQPARCCRYCRGRHPQPPSNVHPTHFKRGDAKRERDGRRFDGFCDTMRKLSLGVGGNWVELGTEALFTRPTECLNCLLKIPKCKTSVIKSLKIA